MTKKPVMALTGATGFLGSHLMAAMLSQGYRLIILGRSAGDESLDQRISRLLNWFEIEPEEGQIETFEIDFLKPDLGLDKFLYDSVCSKAEQIIHCASDTSFSERKRENVLRSNVDSLDGILKFANDSHTEFFHYISTAYVSGSDVKVCMENLSVSTEFENVYEESKALAENLINDHCFKNKIHLSIIRPSVVYGDSRTGRSLRFNALYFPIQSVKYISEIYRNDILNNNGKKAKELGIYLDEEGYLVLPMKIRLPARGWLNIIPVDYFVDATMKIIGKSAEGIFNLTSNQKVHLDEIAVYNEVFMKVRGIEIVYGDQQENEQRNAVEDLFDRFMEPYRFYLSDSRTFDRSNTDRVTLNLQPPEFTSDVFRRCMDYAISVNWGKTIF